MHRHITARIVWRDKPENIQCQVHRGAVLRLEQTSEHITFLEVSLDEDQREDSVVFVTSSLRNFSFFPANVKPGWPMIVPAWGIAVTDAQDTRAYDQILSDMQALHLPKSQDQWRNTPETTFDEAAAATKELRCLSFLGVTRDMRTFDIGFRMDVKETDLHSWIRPTMAGSPMEREKQTVKYEYSVGRAPSCKNTVRRRCEEGYLPIVNAVYTDEGVDYHMQLFCSMEKTPLTKETLAGTNCYVAYTNAPISNPVPNQALMAPYNPQEETVIYMKIEAVNTCATPKYCYVNAPYPDGVNPLFQGSGYGGDNPFVDLDPHTGFACYKTTGLAYMAATVNGQPLIKLETALLLAPGEHACFEFKVPHAPLSLDRMAALSRQDHEQRLAECRAFWKSRLDEAANICLPESRIHEMLRAGLVHINTLAFGEEPNGPMTVNCGYPYAGMEGEVIDSMLYFDSMGLSSYVERIIEFYLNMQNDDGYIGCYYHVATGNAYVLRMVYEHYRYTRDLEWLQTTRDRMLPLADNLIRRIEARKNGSPDVRGYGMPDGRIGDVADTLSSFMFSGLTWAALDGLGQLLRLLNDSESARITAAADELKQNILRNLDVAFAQAPLFPLADGSWIPAMSTYAEHRAPVCMHAESEYTRGWHVSIESSAGVCWLLHLGLIPPEHPYYQMILDLHHELYTAYGCAFQQAFFFPYARLDLLQGNFTAFLREYYYTLAATVDRENYFFLEGYDRNGEGKIHEEAMFCMQTRWMLYLEDGQDLRLLSGIPRWYMEKGLQIQGTASHFGKLDFSVSPDSPQVRVVTVSLALHNHENAGPENVYLRLPHPAKQPILSTELGEILSDGETLRIPASALASPATWVVRYQA